MATVSFLDEEVICLNMANWKEHLSNKELNFFYFPMTAEEFYNKEQNITKLDGQQRMPLWSHVTGVTTLGQAANLLAYHLSEQHIATNSFNTYYVLAIPINSLNILTAISEERARIFSRASINLQRQVLKTYELNKMEFDGMVVLKINKAVHTPLQLFTWNEGFCWSYNIPIHLSHLRDQQLNWFYKQALEYGGTAMTQQLKIQDINLLMNWCYNTGLPMNKPVKTIERLRGSSTLIQWLMDNNQTTMKMIEEAKNNWEEKSVEDQQQDEQQINQRPRGEVQQDELDQIDQQEAYQRAQEIFD